MAVTPKSIPVEAIRTAITEALYPISANHLPAACERLGLFAGDVEEAFSSKRKFVSKRLADYKSDQLLVLAQDVVTEYGAPELADFLSELTTHREHRLTDFTRLAVLKAFDGAGALFGAESVIDGLSVLAPNWNQASEDGAFLETLVDDILRLVSKTGYSNTELLRRCGALVCSQQRFFYLIEKVLHPLSRDEIEQAALAQKLNPLLAADGFSVVVIGEMSRHPVYGLRPSAAGVSGAPKNLIFASITSKPDLYLLDAINNEIGIANESDALIYDQPLSDSGLTWASMVVWWQSLKGEEDLRSAQKALYRRLVASVIEAKSPGEYVLFDTYYREFASEFKAKLPALIPQVYLHYDPKTIAQRGNEPVLVRQRMDLLLLLDRGVRVVIEVDGKQHYADDAVASPAKYAVMAAEDRRLRLLGYDVYRFGGAEFADTRMVGRDFEIGPKSRDVTRGFFQRLLSKHGIAP